MTKREPFCQCGHPRTWHRGDTHNGPCAHGCGCEGYGGKRTHGPASTTTRTSSKRHVDYETWQANTHRLVLDLADGLEALARHLRTIDVTGAELARSTRPRAPRQRVPTNMDPMGLDALDRRLAANGASSPTSTRTSAPAAPTLKAGAVRMLQVLKRNSPGTLTRQQLATLAGFAAGGGTFGEYFSALRRGDFISETGDRVFLTDAGATRAGDVGKLRTDLDRLTQWRPCFKAGAWRMIEAVRERRELTRAELAELADFEESGGTFGEYLGALKRNELLVEDKGTRSIRPGRALYEEASS